MIAEFVGRQTLGNQHDVLDGVADGLVVRRGDDAGHRFACCDSLVSQADQGIPIVGDQNTVLRGGPGENFAVGCVGRSCILNAHQVDLGAATA